MNHRRRADDKREVGDVRAEDVAHRKVGNAFPSGPDGRDEFGQRGAERTTVRPMTMAGIPGLAATLTALSTSRRLPSTTTPAPKRNCTAVPCFVPSQAQRLAARMVSNASASACLATGSGTPVNANSSA